ncbi:hypothetical protein CR513_02016, partial [Mucuna pruriens]
MFKRDKIKDNDYVDLKLNKGSSGSIDNEVSLMSKKFNKILKKNEKYKNHPKKDKYKKYSKVEDREII